MTLIVLLFITGALLFAAEVFLPGGIAGIIGAVALIAGAAVAFVQHGAMIGSGATLAALLLVGILLYAEVVWLPRSRFGRSMVVQSSVDAQSQPPVASADIVGRIAVAATPLSPSGFVMVDERRYEAFSRTGYVARGTPLTVVGLDNFRLIVSENKHP